MHAYLRLDDDSQHIVQTLDVLPYCSERLQQLLLQNRAQAEIDKPDSLISNKRAKPSEPLQAEAVMDVDEDEAALQAALAMSLGGGDDSEASVAPKTTASVSAAATASTRGALGIDIPDNFAGKYELMGVVTHKGRSADSGHYIGWVRQEEGSAHWWKFDDKDVTEVRTADILDLKGGGDWHTAYLSFYRYCGRK